MKSDRHKCFECQDYNKRVGLSAEDLCGMCGSLRIEHPDFIKMRREVQHHEAVNDPHPQYSAQHMWRVVVSKTIE